MLSNATKMQFLEAVLVELDVIVVVVTCDKCVKCVTNQFEEDMI